MKKWKDSPKQKLESNHDPKAKLLYDGYDMMDSYDMTVMIVTVDDSWMTVMI